jgi:hypothetical protein
MTGRRLMYIYCGDQQSKSGAARAVSFFNSHTLYVLPQLGEKNYHFIFPSHLLHLTVWLDQVLRKRTQSLGVGHYIPQPSLNAFICISAYILSVQSGWWKCLFNLMPHKGVVTLQINMLIIIKICRLICTVQSRLVLWKHTVLPVCESEKVENHWYGRYSGYKIWMCTIINS